MKKLIEGIRILNQVANKYAPNWILYLAGIIIIISIIVGVIMGIFLGVNKKDGVSLFFSSLSLGTIVAFMVVVILGLTIQVPDGTYTYQVTIDNTVNFKEFNDKYNVIKQDGEIYTITIKNQN